MNPLTVLVVTLLVLILVGGFPALGLHSYGPYPSGIAGVLLLVVIILLLFGRI